MAAPHTLVIGAGIGGLTAAALLLQGGHRVTVLEAQAYPGGSAGTFYHRGYRFDAGATLAGGFSAAGPHARLAAQLGLTWPVQPVDPAWVTHLPAQSITQWREPARWQAERQRAFPGTERFWQLQERLAQLAWDLSSRPLPWPPGQPADLVTIAKALRPRTLLAAPYLLRTVADLAPREGAGEGARDFAAFLDAQLLISAQTGARQANALYGCAALDLPRRGVSQARGGMGALAQTLVGWIRDHGGEVLYRQAVTQIEVRHGRARGVRTARGLALGCDFLIANQTPWGLADLLGDAAPPALVREVRRRRPTWGAFTLYLGLADQRLPPAAAEHHQVVVDPDQPMGEGNTVFISLSAAGDASRAPAGLRAATLSTHTTAAPWWALAQEDPQAYAARKADYTERLLAAAERALPGLRAGVRLCLPGTPLTFAFYTRRWQGMVGGFAQTSLLQARGPQTGIRNLWLAGDSVFPGQSTAGATLGGWRVADAVLRASRAGAADGGCGPPFR